jgi:hypothetical protein
MAWGFSSSIFPDGGWKGQAMCRFSVAMFRCRWKGSFHPKPEFFRAAAAIEPIATRVWSAKCKTVFRINRWMRKTLRKTAFSA